MIQDARLSFHAMRLLIFEWMTEVGTKHLGVEFSGGGDSGDISAVAPGYTTVEVARRTAAGVNPWHDDKKLDEWSAAFNAKRYTFDGETKTLDEIVREHCDAVFNDPEFPDWVNNDGGHGEIAFEIDDDGKQIVRVDVHIARTEYDSFTFVLTPTGDLRQDGDEEEEPE